jgi:hypothetical protein
MSQLTMSKRPSPKASSPAPASVTASTPDWPGPPGLKNSEPIRCSGRLARWRITARLSLRPFGRAQSNGTRTSAQSSCSPQAVQTIRPAGVALDAKGTTGIAQSEIAKTTTGRPTSPALDVFGALTNLLPKRRGLASGPDAKAAMLRRRVPPRNPDAERAARSASPRVGSSHQAPLLRPRPPSPE